MPKLQRSDVGSVISNMLEEQIEDETDNKAQCKQGNSSSQNLSQPEIMPKFNRIGCLLALVEWAICYFPDSHCECIESNLKGIGKLAGQRTKFRLGKR